MTKQTFDYAAKMNELEGILEKLQSSETPLDEAITLHAQGRSLTTEIEAFLKEAENKIQTVLADEDA